MGAARAPELAAEDYVRHFNRLEHVAGFLRAGGPRAVGFFSSPSSVENTVFLTVAKQLALQSSLAPALARATVGRGTTGCSVYMVPDASARWAHNSTSTEPLLVREFQLPSSPDDASLEVFWKQRPGAPASPLPSPSVSPLPPPISMWNDVLEAEALALHRFLQHGALPEITELTADSVDSLTTTGRVIGLLTFPVQLDASMRRYHIKRLKKLAAAHPPYACIDDKSFDSWFGRPRCSMLPSIRFAFGTSSVSFTMLIASQLGVRATAMPPPNRTPSFAVLVRTTGLVSGDRAQWQPHPLPVPLVWDTVAAKCREHLQEAPHTG